MSARLPLARQALVEIVAARAGETITASELVPEILKRVGRSTPGWSGAARNAIANAIQHGRIQVVERGVYRLERRESFINSGRPLGD